VCFWCNNTIARLKRELGEKDEQISGLKQRIRESEDEATRRRTDLERERREFDEKRSADRSEREREVSVLREEKIRQNEELISLRARNEEFTRDSDTMKAKLAEAVEEVAQIRRGRQALDDERSRREKMISELNEGMEAMRRELDGMKSELSASRKEVDAKNAEITTLKSDEKNRSVKPGAPLSIADNRRLKDLEEEKAKLQNQLKILG
jgi:chromosome segregation ATPase